MSDRRASAILALLEKPDDDGYSRTHRQTVEGEPDRLLTRWPALSLAYRTYRVQEHQDEA